MKKLSSGWGVVLLLLLTVNAFATVRYVNLDSANATPPYTSWSTAATNIQEAIDASTNGDTVLVTNGVYASGGVAMGDGVTNRVTLNSALTVQSVNGPWVTVIQGVYAPTGLTSVRCAWLTNNATLTGFTLKGGGTFPSGTAGGGAWCASSNAVVNNCVIVSNTASLSGTGVYEGTCNNCLISSNNGAGGAPLTAVYNAKLNSCTVVSNNYFDLYPGSATNCIIYYNNEQSSEAGFAYTCTAPLPSGPGNFTNAPQLFADGVHLLSTSPCVGAGTNVVTGTDIFGRAWANPPSIGCAEYTPAPLVTQPAIVFAGYPFGFNVNAAVAGVPAPSLTWLFNGVPLQNNGPFSSTQTSNLVVSSMSLALAGSYQIVASNAFGAVTSAAVTLNFHCVNAAGANPVSPYSTWAAAATNIQDAINAAAAGDVVLVTNGIYEFEVQSMDGVSSNRITLNQPIRVQSVNGPFVTTILGGGATNRTSAIRCAWLTNNASLAGFALTAGATPISGTLAETSGGGVWCASSNCFVENCLIFSNSAAQDGSGVYQGTCYNCLISTNIGNYAAYNVLLNNCTVVSNSDYGVSGGAMTNCIDYYNHGALEYNYTSATASYSCSTPLPAGSGNIASAPELAADGVHLSSDSPCIHTGTNVATGTDIFGMAWANPPSMGCAEFNPLPTAGLPQITLTGEPGGFSLGNVAVGGGQGPFTYQWLENGVSLQNNLNFSSAQNSNLVSTGLSLADAGSYQLVVSNAFGAVTSAAVQLTIHAVNAAGANPQPPYLTWATAATNIQEAIEAASPGDMVLVTNGIYDTGGEAITGGLTNRVALDRALTVMSVNGWNSTIIEGAWDPVSTNGPDAVRCAWLTNGAILSGFTLQNGATQNSGSTATLQSGGGVWGASTNALVSNCLLSNNFAGYGGGGIAFGTLANSLVIDNVAGSFGGAAYQADLNNCTVEDNNIINIVENGGGTYGGVVNNSIVTGNFDGYPEIMKLDNFEPSIYPEYQYSYSYSLNSLGLAPEGTGNTGADPLFVDAYHLSILSPCRGAGSALYASGVDLDNQPWDNPPSMGCSEVVPSERVGPLSVAISVEQSVFPTGTNVLVYHEAFFTGTVTGLASYTTWNFDDGPTISNTDYYTYNDWTNAGSYNVVFTAYNDDNPGGVSTNLVMQVLPVNPPQLQSLTILSNGVQFEFTAQTNADYTVQYATNLAPPVTWQTLENIYVSPGGVTQIQDSPPTNAVRFYRVAGQ